MRLIGASLSEPHINGTVLHEMYVCMYPYIQVYIYICMYVCMVQPSHSVYMRILIW